MTQRARRFGSIVGTLMSRGPCSVSEGILAGVGYLVASFAMYGSHVTRGGFLLDDWALSADYRFYADQGGFLEGLRHLSYWTQGRPIAAVYHTVTHAVFGTNTSLFLAWVTVLAALMSTLFYILLRRLGLERVHALAIALLLLLLPASDTARLWINGAVGLSTMCLYLIGVLLALRAFDCSDRRAAAFLHLASLVAYSLSVLQYEIAAPLILLSIVIYRFSAPWRTVVRRWAVDVVVVAVGLWYVGTHIPREVPDAPGLVDRAWTIARQAVELLERLGIQTGESRIPSVLVAVILIAAAVTWLVLPKDDQLRGDFTRWLGIAGLAALAAAAGWAIFVAANPWYSPLTPGMANRTNVAASLGFVTFVYSLAVLGGLLVYSAVARLAGRVRMRRLVTPERFAAVIALGCAVVAGAAWVQNVNHSKQAYQKAVALEQQALDVLRDTVQKPLPNSNIFTFGVPVETTPNVFVFTGRWDLTGAIQLLWDDHSLFGIPSATVSRDFPLNSPSDWGIRCGPRSVEPRGIFYDRSDASAYGRTWFVDVPARKASLISDRKRCVAAVARLKPLLRDSQISSLGIDQ